MKLIKTAIPEVVIIEPKVFRDQRGYFYESFKQEEFNKNIATVNFIQDNESLSSKGILRGLHFQKPPFSQAKLVRCIKGKVLDVAVDIRLNSPTYGQHVSVELSEENKKQLFIPRGFAHGFVVLSNEAIFAYKVDNNYASTHEGGIIWNDKTLNIDWRIDESEVFLSDKDNELPNFKDFKCPFNY